MAESLIPQMRDGDRVFVVGDTHTRELPEVEAAVSLWPGWSYHPFDAGRHAWGHPQINHGMEIATGDYLLFQDDDDVYCPDALLNVRRAVRHGEPRPFLFKFRAQRAGGATFWMHRGQVVENTIGGHCMVVPNVKDKLGKWTDRYAGDFDFIEETLRLWEPTAPEWRQEVIVHAR